MNPRAQITTWYSEAQWGFATTAEGKEFFVHKYAFRNHRQVQRAHCGSIIEFDLPVAQTAEQAFLDKLNAGEYRDDPSVARNHRNPRRMVIKNKKPKALNIVLVDNGSFSRH
jgi:cold shock CspA family protein